MIGFHGTQLQPIALDIGFDSVKMLQLATSGSTLSVHAAARMTIPHEARGASDLRLPVAIDLVRQMLRHRSFSGRRIITSLPREIVHVKNLRLPMMPPAELASAVEFEARTIFPFDTEQAQIRFLHAGEVRQGVDVRQEVIVLAAQNQDIDNFLEQINRCGAIVESLDWEPTALYRSIERFIRRREDEQEVHVLIDVGLRCTQVIIGKGRDISFFKPIDIGGQKFNESVSRKLAITQEEAAALRRRMSDLLVNSDEKEKRDPVRQAVFDASRSLMEELAREISLCLRYYSVTFRGQRPNRVRVLGGEANNAQLLATLNAALPIPAEPGRLMQSIDLSGLKPADRSRSLCEWSSALGLGLKLTRTHFGSRDGTSRQVQLEAAKTENPIEPQAEVVDLNRAINGGETAQAPASPTEVAHA